MSEPDPLARLLIDHAAFIGHLAAWLATTAGFCWLYGWLPYWMALARRRLRQMQSR